jgi:hypothetical protein
MKNQRQFQLNPNMQSADHSQGGLGIWSRAYSLVFVGSTSVRYVVYLEMAK